MLGKHHAEEAKAQNVFTKINSDTPLLHISSLKTLNAACTKRLFSRSCCSAAVTDLAHYFHAVDLQ